MLHLPLAAAQDYLRRIYVFSLFIVLALTRNLVDYHKTPLHPRYYCADFENSFKTT